MDSLLPVCLWDPGTKISVQQLQNLKKGGAQHSFKLATRFCQACRPPQALWLPCLVYICDLFFSDCLIFMTIETDVDWGQLCVFANYQMDLFYGMSAFKGHSGLIPAYSEPHQ